MPLVNSKIFQKFFGSREDTLKNIGMLAFFFPSVTDPIIYHFAVRGNKKFSDDQKKTMISQNWSHHSFNLALEVFSLILSKPIINYFFKGKPKATLNFYKTVGGFMAMIIAKSFIRPFVMIKFAEKEKLKDKKKPGHAPAAPALDINANVLPATVQSPYPTLNYPVFKTGAVYTGNPSPKLATSIG